MDDALTYKERILVTGGAGFIGSNFLNAMVPAHLETLYINLDALTYAGDLAHVTVSSAKNYRFEKADIRNLEALTRIFETYQPTHVIHFAAESHVDQSIKNPDIFIETNVLGTHHLLELSRAHGVTRFHYVSTDEVYGSLSLTAPSSKESDELIPSSPYSASKAAGEMLTRAAHHTFGLDTVITRASNNYGPYQHEEKFLPLSIRRVLEGATIPLYGKGTNVRNWLHVSDHVAGVEAAFRKGASGAVYNLGGATELPNIELLRKLLALMGKDENSIEYVTDRLGHDVRYSLDSSKAKKELGWEPKISLEEGLKETLAFYGA